MLRLPSISVAASWQQSNFLSSGINGIEQYILVKKKGGGGEKREEKKEPMIAGLPICHLSTKSSPLSPTTMLSDLIMWRIKLREGKKWRPTLASNHSLSQSKFFWGYMTPVLFKISPHWNIKGTIQGTYQYYLNNNVAVHFSYHFGFALPIS